MKIYFDLLFLFNWWIDFFLLILVKLLLKRNVFLKRILIASFFGSFITFLIFININAFLLFLLKIVSSFLLVIIAFKFNNIIYTIKNVLYLFIFGVIFGGFALFIKENINNNIIYIITIILLTPIFIFFFLKQNKIIKSKYNLYYEVTITIIGYKTLNLCGFLDSGNNLYDPVTKKNVILTKKSIFKGINKIRSPMYIPAKTINNSSLIKCYKPDKIFINSKEYTNCLVGLIDNNVFIDGVDCLLNNRMMEDL